MSIIEERKERVHRSEVLVARQLACSAVAQTSSHLIGRLELETSRPFFRSGNWHNLDVFAAIVRFKVRSLSIICLPCCGLSLLGPLLEQVGVCLHLQRGRWSLHPGGKRRWSSQLVRHYSIVMYAISNTRTDGRKVSIEGTKYTHHEVDRGLFRI